MDSPQLYEDDSIDIFDLGPQTSQQKCQSLDSDLFHEAMGLKGDTQICQSQDSDLFHEAMGFKVDTMQSLRKDNESLKEENHQLKMTQQHLLNNMAALLASAQKEIKQKEKEIADLKASRQQERERNLRRYRTSSHRQEGEATTGRSRSRSRDSNGAHNPKTHASRSSQRDSEISHHSSSSRHPSHKQHSQENEVKGQGVPLSTVPTKTVKAMYNGSGLHEKCVFRQSRVPGLNLADRDNFTCQPQAKHRRASNSSSDSPVSTLTQEKNTTYFDPRVRRNHGRSNISENSGKASNSNNNHVSCTNRALSNITECHPNKHTAKKFEPKIDCIQPEVLTAQSDFQKENVHQSEKTFVAGEQIISHKSHHERSYSKYKDQKYPQRLDSRRPEFSKNFGNSLDMKRENDYIHSHGVTERNSDRRRSYSPHYKRQKKNSREKDEARIKYPGEKPFGRAVPEAYQRKGKYDAQAYQPDRHSEKIDNWGKAVDLNRKSKYNREAMEYELRIDTPEESKCLSKGESNSKPDSPHISYRDKKFLEKTSRGREDKDGIRNSNEINKTDSQKEAALNSTIMNAENIKSLSAISKSDAKQSATHNFNIMTDKAPLSVEASGKPANTGSWQQQSASKTTDSLNSSGKKNHHLFLNESVKFNGVLTSGVDKSRACLEQVAVIDSSAKSLNKVRKSSGGIVAASPIVETVKQSRNNFNYSVDKHEFKKQDLISLAKSSDLLDIKTIKNMEVLVMNKKAVRDMTGVLPTTDRKQKYKTAKTSLTKKTEEVEASLGDKDTIICEKTETRPTDKSIECGDLKNTPLMDTKAACAVPKNTSLVNKTTECSDQKDAPLINKKKFVGDLEDTRLVDKKIVCADQKDTPLVDKKTIVDDHKDAPLVDKKTIGYDNKDAPLIDKKTTDVNYKDAPLIDNKTVCADQKDAPQGDKKTKISQKTEIQLTDKRIECADQKDAPLVDKITVCGDHKNALLGDKKTDCGNIEEKNKSPCITKMKVQSDGIFPKKKKMYVSVGANSELCPENSDSDTKSRRYWLENFSNSSASKNLHISEHSDVNTIMESSEEAIQETNQGKNRPVTADRNDYNIGLCSQSENTNSASIVLKDKTGETIVDSHPACGLSGRSDILNSDRGTVNETVDEVFGCSNADIYLTKTGDKENMQLSVSSDAVMKTHYCQDSAPDFIKSSEQPEACIKQNARSDIDVASPIPQAKSTTLFGKITSPVMPSHCYKDSVKDVTKGLLNSKLEDVSTKKQSQKRQFSDDAEFSSVDKKHEHLNEIEKESICESQDRLGRRRSVFVAEKVNNVSVSRNETSITILNTENKNITLLKNDSVSIHRSKDATVSGIGDLASHSATEPFMALKNCSESSRKYSYSHPKKIDYNASLSSKSNSRVCGYSSSSVEHVSDVGQKDDRIEKRESLLKVVASTHQDVCAEIDAELSATKNSKTSGSDFKEAAFQKENNTAAENCAKILEIYNSETLKIQRGAEDRAGGVDDRSVVSSCNAAPGVFDRLVNGVAPASLGIKSLPQHHKENPKKKYLRLTDPAISHSSTTDRTSNRGSQDTKTATVVTFPTDQRQMVLNLAKPVAHRQRDDKSPTGRNSVKRRNEGWSTVHKPGRSSPDFFKPKGRASVDNSSEISCDGVKSKQPKESEQFSPLNTKDSSYPLNIAESTPLIASARHTHKRRHSDNKCIKEGSDKKFRSCRSELGDSVKFASSPSDYAYLQEVASESEKRPENQDKAFKKHSQLKEWSHQKQNNLHKAGISPDCLHILQEKIDNCQNMSSLLKHEETAQLSTLSSVRKQLFSPSQKFGALRVPDQTVMAFGREEPNLNSCEDLCKKVLNTSEKVNVDHKDRRLFEGHGAERTRPKEKVLPKDNYSKRNQGPDSLTCVSTEGSVFANSSQQVIDHKEKTVKVTRDVVCCEVLKKSQAGDEFCASAREPSVFIAQSDQISMTGVIDTSQAIPAETSAKSDGLSDVKSSVVGESLICSSRVLPVLGVMSGHQDDNNVKTNASESLPPVKRKEDYCIRNEKLSNFDTFSAMKIGKLEKKICKHVCVVKTQESHIASPEKHGDKSHNQIKASHVSKEIPSILITPESNGPSCEECSGGSQINDPESITYITCTSNLILLGDEDTCNTLISPAKLQPSDFYPPGERGIVYEGGSHARHIRGFTEVIKKLSNSPQEKTSTAPPREDINSNESTKINTPEKYSLMRNLHHDSSLMMSQKLAPVLNLKNGRRVHHLHKFHSPELIGADCSGETSRQEVNINKSSVKSQDWMSAVNQTFARVFQKELNHYKEETVLVAKPKSAVTRHHRKGGQCSTSEVDKICRHPTSCLEVANTSSPSEQELPSDKKGKPRSCQEPGKSSDLVCSSNASQNMDLQDEVRHPNSSTRDWMSIVNKNFANVFHKQLGQIKTDLQSVSSLGVKCAPLTKSTLREQTMRLPTPLLK